ncbi:hypothetical protein QZH41_001071 [Actinostola sp. cb2023]|nr:hypothetical protein QZH41_001071 [Actinostola sp. cb2023]
MKKDEPPTFCDLPPKPSHNIVERYYEVSLVMKEIERLRSTYPHQITTTYISGNPGSGKSELARQIGGKYFDDVDSEVSLKFVTTLNASTLDTLIQSYMDFAIQLRCNEMSITTIATSSEKLSQEEKLAHLKGLISPALQKYSSWLIIVDNVEDLQLVSRFIPLAGQRLHGHILVTTQDSQSIPLSDDTYNMSISTGMRSDDAVRSLLSISGYHDGDDMMVQQVAETLDFQPLALACAGVYMRQARGTDPSMNWKKCLQKIEQGKRELTERPYEKINSSYRNSMTTAVKMAVKNEIEKNPVILHTFQFMSLMAPEFISLEHVVNYVMKCLPDDDKESVAAYIVSSSLILKSEDKSKPTVRVHQFERNLCPDSALFLLSMRRVVVIRKGGEGEREEREKGRRGRKGGEGEREEREKGRKGRKEGEGEREEREKGRRGRKGGEGEREEREKGRKGRKGGEGETEEREKGRRGRKGGEGEREEREKGRKGRKGGVGDFYLTSTLGSNLSKERGGGEAPFFFSPPPPKKKTDTQVTWVPE